MWRTRAVVSMLVEDVAGLATPKSARDVSAGEIAAATEAALARAQRRAKWAIVVDWIALLVLFILRDRAGPFLPWNATIDTVFTLGALAIGVHSGLRWGQLEKLRAVARLCQELRERDPD